MPDFWERARSLVRERTREGGFWRALHGYSPCEGFPRFHLDRYGEWWLAVFHSPDFESRELGDLAEFLASTASGVVLKFRNDDRKAPALGRVVSGDAEAARSLTVEQAGYRFEARLSSSLDAGAYPDAERLRAHLMATSSGKKLLNLYAYTCLFGVAAAKGGARGVVNVDLSRARLKWGQRNYQLNSLRADGRDFVAQDAPLFCRRQARAGATFDAIVVDPPPFYTTGKLRRSSDELLEKDLEAVLPLAAPGETTIHFLQCTARVSEGELRSRVETVLAASPRAARFEVLTWKGPPISPEELAPSFKEARIVLSAV
ncbi:class I SAM-dependent methyltransferase [bacterium]|nr:class I SAM-dependent methyltransferase [bacterium]